MRWNGPLDPDALNRVPAAAGSYGLLLLLPGEVDLVVGRLGVFRFPAGIYVYLGSAHGPGGLRARLAHHARLSSHPHWHLDALRPHAEIVGGFWEEEIQPISPGALPLECGWSQGYASRPGAEIIAPGFGASDCRGGCPSHLIYLGSKISTF